MISTSQNGSGVATTSVEYFDDLGRLRWNKDGEGFCNYYSYHPETGELAYEVKDVDPAVQAGRGRPGQPAVQTTTNQHATVVCRPHSH